MSLLIKCLCCKRKLSPGRYTNQLPGTCADCSYDQQSGLHPECRWKDVDSGRQCEEYSPVYQPTPLRQNAGVCHWYIFHGRPCHSFMPRFYCQNGYHNEFKEKPKRSRKRNPRAVKITKIRNGKVISEKVVKNPVRPSAGDRYQF